MYNCTLPSYRQQTNIRERTFSNNKLLTTESWLQAMDTSVGLVSMNRHTKATGRPSVCNKQTHFTRVHRHLPLTIWQYALTCKQHALHLEKRP